MDKRLFPNNCPASKGPSPQGVEERLCREEPKLDSQFEGIFV